MDQDDLGNFEIHACFDEGIHLRSRNESCYRSRPHSKSVNDDDSDTAYDHEYDPGDGHEVRQRFKHHNTRDQGPDRKKVIVRCDDHRWSEAISCEE